MDAPVVLWPKDRIKRARYEDLVQFSETSLKKLRAFLEIDWQAEMIQVNGFECPLYTQGQHTLIGNGPDASRAEAWKKDLTPRQIELFESLTCDFLQYLGYSLEYNLKTKRPTRMERFGAEISEFARGKLVNGLRLRIRKYSGTRKSFPF